MPGFFIVHRKIFKNYLFERGEFCKGYAWLWLLSEASYEDRDFRVGYKKISLKRGQLSHSIRYMADVWGWPKSNAQRFLNRLKSDHMIDTDTRSGQLIITICNYEEYQGQPEGQFEESGTDTGTIVGQSRDKTNKETNKQILDTPSGDLFSKPSKAKKKATRLDDDWQLPKSYGVWAVEQGFSEFQIRRQAETFKDYWIGVSGAKGVKLDWFATWRNWMRRVQNTPTGRSQQQQPQETLAQRVLREQRGQ
jgi:hypothetical protein